MSGESKMWVATIDFMKAFDSISHNPIWDALKTCSIEHELALQHCSAGGLEILTREESTKYLGQIVTFQKQERPR